MKTLPVSSTTTTSQPTVTLSLRALPTSHNPTTPPWASSSSPPSHHRPRPGHTANKPHSTTTMILPRTLTDSCSSNHQPIRTQWTIGSQSPTDNRRYLPNLYRQSIQPFTNPHHPKQCGNSLIEFYVDLFISLYSNGACHSGGHYRDYFTDTLSFLFKLLLLI